MPSTTHHAVWRVCLLVTILAPIARGASTKFIDVTVPVAAGLPVFQSSAGLPKNWRSQHQDISEGDVCNQSTFLLDAHTGTHVDAPYHFVDKGVGIEMLDLDILIGKTLVVDFPAGSNITGDALQKLQLPKEAVRVLFKTDNSAKKLMFRKEFVPSYTSFDSTGATYITKHTNIKLVGIDYLSIGCLEDIVKTHQILLGQGVIAVEGLDLTHVEPGWYHQICLPAKMKGSDGAPIRCVLQQLGEAGASHNEL